MRRPGYMFTNKSHPERGIFSTALGLLAVVSTVLAVYLSFRGRGEANPRYGLAVLFSLLFSLAGLVLGILSHMEKDKFYLFPRIGIVLNGLEIILAAFILYAGV